MGWDAPAGKKPTAKSDKVKREECKAWFLNAKDHKCYMKENDCPAATAPRTHAGHTCHSRSYTGCTCTDKLHRQFSCCRGGTKQKKSDFKKPAVKAKKTAKKR